MDLDISIKKMNGMKSYGLLFFQFLNVLILGFSQNLEPGSCSRKCQRISVQDNTTLTVSGADARRVLSSLCSCTSSCKIYKDCCYDSDFRSQGVSPFTEMICLTLTGKGIYKAVANCPENRRGSSFCRGGIGHLPPVTSRNTGITYANIHCAVCNDDAERYVAWKVDLRCCSEHENLEQGAERNFFYRNGYIRSVISGRTYNIKKSCICKYILQEKDDSLVDSLELRTCTPNFEISTCSISWTNEIIYDMCNSFLDPVYIRGKVYRNIYCAQCNYERLALLNCKPAVVKRMISEGLDDEAIINNCQQNNHRDCIYFFMNGKIYTVEGRGGFLTFRSLMNINVAECLPEAGSRCCAGQIYDFRSRRCRTVH